MNKIYNQKKIQNCIFSLLFTFKLFSFSFFLFPLILFSNSDIQKAYAIGIFDENGNGENIQHSLKTENDYNGTVFSKIAIFNHSSNDYIEVFIGDSKGYFEKKIPIYNRYKIKIGEEMTFKHYNTTKGNVKVYINNRLFDSKVLVK